MGVFASRSPFRPNPIGLSSVRLDHIAYTDALGPVLHVRGADLVDGTPILDIKPYLPYGDCHPEATGGFASEPARPTLEVEIPPACWTNCLRTGGRPAGCVGLGSPSPVSAGPDRVYGFLFAGQEVRFTVDGDRLQVVDIK